MLYWISGKGSYNQFVRNSVNKILERDDNIWQYVPTRDNPADLGSRWSLLTTIPEIWWKDPYWWQVKENWPRKQDIKTSVESEKEVKISKEHKSIVITAAKIQGEFDLILQEFDLNNALRVPACIVRFINICRKSKKLGPLTTAELVNQKKIH